jgi:hypothetical protein
LRAIAWAWFIETFGVGAVPAVAVPLTSSVAKDAIINFCISLS